MSSVASEPTIHRHGPPSPQTVRLGALHVPPAWPGTPEARDALHRIASFVADLLPGAPEPSRRAEEEEASDRGADDIGPGPPGAPGRT